MSHEMSKDKVAQKLLELSLLKYTKYAKIRITDTRDTQFMKAYRVISDKPDCAKIQFTALLFKTRRIYIP